MGLEFNGTNGQKISLSNVNLANGWTEYTVASWIKSNEINSDHGWFQMSAPDNRDRFGGVRFDESGIDGSGSNNLKFGLEISNTEYIVESASNVQSTDLMFIVGRWKSGSPLEIFIDGELSIPSAQETGTGSLTSQDDIFLGCGCKNGSDSFNGTVYDHRVYNVWLTDEEIKTMSILAGKDSIFRGLQLWYKFSDGAEGSSISTINDWSSNRNDITGISSGNIITDLSNTYIRRI